MKNSFYEKTIYDDYKVNQLTILDFIKVCDMLKLPVFEVKIILNPFAEPQRTVNARTYESMAEYRKTMPSWSAREYDYENDRESYYLKYPDIVKGVFEVRAENNSSLHTWTFEVAGECVLIHHIYSITD